MVTAWAGGTRAAQILYQTLYLVHAGAPGSSGSFYLAETFPPSISTLQLSESSSTPQGCGIREHPGLVLQHCSASPTSLRFQQVWALLMHLQAGEWVGKAGADQTSSSVGISLCQSPQCSRKTLSPLGLSAFGEHQPRVRARALFSTAPALSST